MQPTHRELDEPRKFKGQQTRTSAADDKNARKPITEVLRETLLSERPTIDNVTQNFLHAEHTSNKDV